MPHVLLAGVLAEPPKIDRFPAGNSRPRAEALIKVEGNEDFLYRILAFNEMIDLIELLQSGDALSVQGQLQIELAPAKKGRAAILVGIFVTAMQITCLRKRSINALGWLRGFKFNG